MPERHSRRQFLQTTAVGSMALAGARAAGAASAEPDPQGAIDCQSHMYPEVVLDYMETRTKPPLAYRRGDQRYTMVGQWHRRVRAKHTDVAAKLADMDRVGIATTALTINDPGPETFGEDGLKMARMANDFLGETAKAHPGRFIPLALLPLQDMDASLKELDRCVNELGARGILLYSNLNGQFPDEPQFRPLFARAEEMGLPLFLHPADPVTFEVTKGRNLIAGLGLMFDTTIALARMILAGMLEQHPKLKLVCPHVGGTLPYLIGRLDHQTMVLKRGAENIKKPPSEYLKQVYLDVVTPLPLAIKFAYDMVGPDKLLYGSDHPWVDPALIMECVKSLGLPAEDEQKIFRGNAAKLFGL
jgi:predicted TIM-barrel fold metal-dependent hydrolase